MKFTIMGFSQEKMIEFKMDLTDALILRWFVDFKDTGKMYSEVIEKDKFYWVNYKDGLLKDIPIINIDKVSIGRRMKKMSENGILKQYIKKEGGTFTMYCLGEKYSLLISSTVKLESSEGCTLKSNGVKLESSEGLNLKVQTKNYSTKEINILNNNSTNNKKTSSYKQIKSDNIVSLEVYNYYCKKIKEDDKKQLGLNNINSYIAEYGTNKLLYAIDRYSEETEGREEQYKKACYSFFAVRGEEIGFFKDYINKKKKEVKEVEIYNPLQQKENLNF